MKRLLNRVPKLTRPAMIPQPKSYNFHYKFALLSIATIGAVSMTYNSEMAEAKPKPNNDMDFCVKNIISEKYVKGGDSNQKVIFHLHDS